MQQDEIARTIGTKVRSGRARIGMTRKQLAAAADVSERYLNELENGSANASVGVLVKVAEALGQDFASLLTASEVRSAGYGPLHALLAGMSPAEQEGAVKLLRQYLEERRRRLCGVALLGLRGAGKTTLGQHLAERHNLPFVSITREIEARAGMSLNDLFNLGGPSAYRSLENAVIGDIIRRNTRVILETAGGIVGNSEALEMILASFKTVWLKASPQEHLSRVARQGDTRPMHGNPRALEHLKALLAAREAEYARAEFSLDTSGRTVEACLVELEAIAAPALQ